MRRLSPDAKEAIVQQALNRGSEPLESIAQANNISLSSLNIWLRRYRSGVPISRTRGRKPRSEDLSREEQFNHLLATKDLDDVSLGQYCREHGLYSHQLTQWREGFMTTPQSEKNLLEKSELKKLKEENKQLQRELRRKDKALAEASALLILKKKADLIWGGSEDD